MKTFDEELKEVTLENGRKIHVDKKDFEEFKKSIKKQDVNKIVKYSMRMVASCPEFLEDFKEQLKKLREIHLKKTNDLKDDK